ncbi:MAG: (Fe-S)-binding protein, partial [Desulforhopalus sp.]
HCTMCGKCPAPCPVDIDTTAVSVLERELLSDLGYKHTAPATRLSLAYLQSRNRLFNTLFRKAVLQWGSGLQRLGAQALEKAPAVINGKNIKPFALLRSPMTPATAKSLDAILPQCSEHEALMIPPPEAAEKTVFYFPGCGSERLYSNIAMAAIYLLLKNNIRIILPPPFLCCGFPAKANAKKKMHGNITLRDTIILSQIREMLGHLLFDAFLVSCGTCRETIHEIGCADIFDCVIEDISAYVLENCAWDYHKEKLSGGILYHAPCHDSFDGAGANLLGRVYKDVTVAPNCCSEAGTMAISRPDISHAMLNRKKASIKKVKPAGGNTIIATNCPSCLSGLGRSGELGITPTHMAVLLAEYLGGRDWMNELLELTSNAEKVTF